MGPRAGIVAVAVSMVMSMLGAASPASATVSGNDGRIAFVSAVSGSDQIYLIDPDGSNLEQITSFDATAPVIGAPRWSPDGRTLTFGLAGAGTAYDDGVWIVNSDGTELEHVTDGGTPSWSPDGRSLDHAH